MTSQKRLDARREKNRALAQRDARARCQHCREPLSSQKLAAGFRFCSDDCRDAALDYIDNVVERLK